MPARAKILLKLVVILGSVDKLFILGKELMNVMARKD